MTGTNDKLRGLILATLMVMSVFAMTVAFSGSVAAAANAASIDEAVEYSGGTVEIVFNTSVNSVDSVELIVDGNTDSTINNPATSSSGNRVEVSATGDITPNQNLTVIATVDKTGNQNQRLVSEDVTVTATAITDTGVNVKSATQVYQGEPIAAVSNGNFGRSVKINRRGGGVVLDGNLGSNSEVLVYDTDNLVDGATYRTSFTGGSNHHFNISDLQLSATLVNTSDVQLDEDAHVDVSAIRGNSGIVARLLESDGDVEDVHGLDLDGSGEATAKLSASSKGEYQIEVVDNQTGNTVTTDNVTFIKEPDGEVNFNRSSYTEDRGDIVNITMTIDAATDATVHFGSDDAGYEFNVTASDDSGDGNLKLQLNTFKVDDDSDLVGEELTIADSDDSLSLASGDEPTTADIAGPDQNDILAAGTYDIGVRLGTDETDASDDVATVTLRERSNATLTTWTAPGAIESDISELSDVYERVGINITQDTSIADSDLMIQEISAPGLEGVIRNETSDWTSAANPAKNATEAWVNISETDESNTPLTEVISLSLNQTDTQLNRAPKETTFAKAWEMNGSSGVTLLADYANDTYFAVWDISDSAFGRDGGSTTAPSDGNQFDTNFTVYSYNQNDNNYGLVAPQADGDFENEVSMSSWSVVDNEATVNTGRGDIVRVQAAANQTISGTATIAHGTEISVRIQTKQGASNAFLIPKSPLVEKGKWSVDVDFANRTVGTEFTVDVREGGSSLLDSKADGIIQGEPVVNSLTFEDQDSTGDSVIVQGANLSDGGFVAIHIGSASGDIIGSTRYLDPGESASNLGVGLSQTVDDGTTLVAMPHLDQDNNERFDPATDGPYTEDGSPVTESATITVSGEATPPPTPTPRVITATPGPTPTPRVVTETVMVTPTPGQQGPGFGVIVALIALVAAALLAVRRKN